MRLYKAPIVTARATPPVQSRLENSMVTTNLVPIRTSMNNNFQSFRQYLNRANLIRPIRGKELFIRSIRRIIEQIQQRKKESANFATIEEAIAIFTELTFVKCMQLKKQLLDPQNRAWTIEFARQGGLQALLTYLEQVASKGLSLVDAILVNEALQCLRAMMNIGEIFEHIVEHSEYVDSIAKGKERHTNQGKNPFADAGRPFSSPCSVRGDSNACFRTINRFVRLFNRWVRISAKSIE